MSKLDFKNGSTHYAGLASIWWVGYSDAENELPKKVLGVPETEREKAYYDGYRAGTHAKRC